MKKLIEKFVSQCEEALQITKEIKLKSHDFNKIFITGMGGSGIAGRFVQEISNKYSSTPVIVSNNYTIPSWIDKKCLCIVSSYSGNTDETIAAYENIKLKNANIVAITSGGDLIKRAKKDGFEIIIMPTGWPAPRACLGYSLIFQLYVLIENGVLPSFVFENILTALNLLKNKTLEIKDEAANIAQLLGGYCPIIYSSSDYEPVALRFRQQLNENSKSLAFNSVIPEMNHNEIAAWVQSYPNVAAIFLKAEDYLPQINKRIAVTKEILIDHVDVMIELEAIGLNFIERLFYLVHLTDWISYYLAESQNIDAMNISNIDFLKLKLSE